MANDVTLPRLGQGMESGTIVRWLKGEGDKVEKGEPLYELDTEKVTQEVEADASGFLLKILASEGAEIAVGEPVAVIGEEGEDVQPRNEEPERGAEPTADVPGKSEEAETPGRVEPGEAGEEMGVEKPAEAPAREEERERGREAGVEQRGPLERARASRRDGGRLKASPLARRLAREGGVELTEIEGTGPEGRIVAEDVERAVAALRREAPTAAPSPAEFDVVRLTQTRRTIARRMTEAWQTPHFQIAMSADMTEAIRLREKLVARAEDAAARDASPDSARKQVRPTYSDILTKACAAALMKHGEMNAHFAGDEVRLFRSANIGVAVAVPQGLVVPVIHGCERLTLAEIARARADIVERARAGKLGQGDLEGGTFTISNLGMYGVERFVAVLNPPQAGILAVGGIEERAVVDQGEIVVRPLMEMTLSCDHRSVDGAAASEFLRSVKELLEEPALML
ncbi:MAG: 2-oxo acid dehydrogenase subunit E2 [Actinomycetota bacterium]|nr:2-oxo acid dehydrogenase subunit E2 [Actinomycetota bacterium]